MFSFLSLLGFSKSNTKKKAKGSAPTAAKKASTATSKSATASSSAKVAAKADGAKPKTGIASIENLNSVPGYFSVMSVPNGELALSGSEMIDYIMLRLSEDKNDVLVIRSSDKIKAGIDHTFMTIRERIKNKGLRIAKEYVANRQIIKLLYEKNFSGERREVKNKSEIINSIDALLKDGVNNKVSDIHIEVRRDFAEVRFRKHGDCYLRHDWPVQYAKDTSVVIYQVMAEEKDVTFNPSVAQDAVLDRTIDGKRLRVRIGTMPAAPDGFDVVMRLMPFDEDNIVEVSDLGYLDEQLADIEMGLSKPIGVIVLAGVTGSGKTTSLVAMVRGIIADEEGRIKVITVENPPEQYIRGATQQPVVTRQSTGTNGKSEDSPYVMAMKAALRGDPDILMVGEVRDRPTAKLLIDAVQSGHKVLTTIHAPSGIGIVGRMRSMGIPNDVLGGGDFFSALIYQTLVRTVCPHCSHTLQNYKEENHDNIKFQKLLKRLAMTVENLDEANIRFVNKKGCKHVDCDAGITGRTVVAEIILPDHAMMTFFANGQDMLAWKHFRESGGKSSLMVGIEKMKMGILDPFDVEKSLGMLNSELIMADGIFNYEEERITTADVKKSPIVEIPESINDSEGYIAMDEPAEELKLTGKFESEFFSDVVESAEILDFKARVQVPTAVVDAGEEDYDPAS